MTEVLMMTLLPAGVLLWMLGGYKWKGWRRFVWPVLAGVVLGLAGVSLPRASLAAAALCGVNHLPYGDRTPWPARVGVFIALLAPSLALSFQAVPVVILGGLALSGAFLASRKVSWVTHKVWEGLAGFLQAAVLIMAAL